MKADRRFSSLLVCAGIFSIVGVPVLAQVDPDPTTTGEEWAKLVALDDTVPGTGDATQPDFLFGVGNPDGTDSDWLADGSMALLAVSAPTSDPETEELAIYWVDQLTDFGFEMETVLDPAYHVGGEVGAGLDHEALYLDTSRDMMVFDYYEMEMPVVDPDPTPELTIDSHVIWFPYGQNGNWCAG